MKLLLQLCMLFALSSAFIVPRNISDGIYVHTFHQNGSSKITSLSHALHHGTVYHTPERSIEPRDLPFPPTTVTCGNGNKEMYYLNQSDILGAMKKFHDGCTPAVDLGGVFTGKDFFAVHGRAIVFMCNYGGRWCKNDEFDEAFNMIRRECGDHTGQNTGFVRIWEWYKSYGFDHSKNDICR